MAINTQLRFLAIQMAISSDNKIIFFYSSHTTISRTLRFTDVIRSPGLDMNRNGIRHIRQIWLGSCGLIDARRDFLDLVWGQVECMTVRRHWWMNLNWKDFQLRLRLSFFAFIQLLRGIIPHSTTPDASARWGQQQQLVSVSVLY